MTTLFLEPLPRLTESKDLTAKLRQERLEFWHSARYAPNAAMQDMLMKKYHDLTAALKLMGEV